MTTKTNKPRRALATLHLPRNAAAAIAYATGIVKAMTGNAYFPSPTPPLATVQSAIDAVQAAQIAILTRAPGTAAVRDEKRAVLVTHLEALRGYVQVTADGSPENGGSIIQSSGMAMRRAAVLGPRGFRAKPAGVSGSVKLAVPAAAARASYEWQFSTDGGKTWVAAPGTLRAKTTVTGLAPQTTVQFRYRALTKTGEGDWSQPVALVVV